MILDFDWVPDMTEASFKLGKSNSHIYKWLQNTRFWPNKHLILYGPSFSGKTHLSKIWGSRNHALDLLRETEFNPRINYTVDDISSITDEKYLMRILCQSQAHVLWIMNDQYQETELILNDLKTRLNSMLRLKITEPDEDLFGQILQKRCQDFGLKLSSENIEYLIKRLPITYAAIETFVILLHKECLIQQKAPSNLLIHNVLQGLEEMY